MKSINNDNIDEIMFALLEGDIQGVERVKLLEAIEADQEYKKMWEIWQNTVVSPDEAISMNTKSLIRKPERKGLLIAFPVIRYAAAAALVISVGAYLYFSPAKEAVMVKTLKEPVKPNAPSIVAPKPSQNILPPENNVSDSSKPLKERIKNMASKQDPSILPAPEPEKAPETPVIQQNLFNEIPEPVFANTNIEKSTDPVSPSAVSDVQVTVTNYKENTKEVKSKKSLISRVFGAYQVRIENDSNTITKRKLVIDNDKYQIIAGF